jgi:acyl-CoA synthetase (AMP-forming)/AMP-acid ligase II
MRPIIVTTFVSLDGVMQAPGGPGEDDSGGFAYGGWSVKYWDALMGDVMGKIMDSSQYLSDHMGEVPVAFVSCRDDAVTETELIELCRRDLTGYKRPRQFHFIDFADFPRSTSGKVQRHELENRLVRAQP